MIPLRLVIDTNIIVSAVLKPDGLPWTVLLLEMTKPAGLYVTEAILAAYREVLARPELRIRAGLRQQMLQHIKNHARLVARRDRCRSRRTPTTTSFWNAPMPPGPTTS